MGHPTVTAVHLTSSELSRLTQVSDHVEERLLGLSQVAYKGRPVVHLGIDVDRVFRIPGGVQFVVPDTLQVGCLSTGLRGRYQQVTAVLHHQRHHVGIMTVGEGDEALVGGEA